MMLGNGFYSTDGYDVITNQSDWSYRLTEDNMGIEYTFNNSGTYTIRRV